MKEIVEKYLAVRAYKEQRVAEHKAELAKLNDALDKAEAALLRQFNELGVDSVKTAAGTAYKTTRTSATVADWDVVLDFVRDNELWNMFERRVSKTAVEQYREEHGAIPPGVSVREEVVINVRKSS